MSEGRTLRQNLRELPPAAWVLFAGTFINRFGSFVMTFLILYLTRRGFSAQEAGAAVAKATGKAAAQVATASANAAANLSQTVRAMILS